MSHIKNKHVAKKIEKENLNLLKKRDLLNSIQFFLSKYTSLVSHIPWFLQIIPKILYYINTIKLNTLLASANGNIIVQQNTFELNKRQSNLDLGTILGRNLKKFFSYKYFYSRLYFYDLKFNNHNLLPLKDITKKRYDKKIDYNFVGLKYLYLDSNILAEAITSKLKDRKKQILRVFKSALGLVKKPYFNIHFYKKNINLERGINLDSLFLDRNINIDLADAVASLKNDIVKNKYLISKPSNYKARLLLYHIKHKIVNGIRLEGTGRLTRRLTASRSISKFRYMGTLKNIYSSRESISTIMLRGFMKSNLQYMNINNNNRNGAFGIKVSVSSY
jgi:hypothetical protein